MLNIEDVDKLLNMLAAADHFHNVTSQDKALEKAKTWRGILGEVDYDACVQAINAHYRHQGAKSMTPGVLRALAVSFTAAQERSLPIRGSVESDTQRERACSSAECRCTHTECFNGFLDEEEYRTRNGQEYKTVVRCPQCRIALEARTGVSA